MSLTEEGAVEGLAGAAIRLRETSNPGGWSSSGFAMLRAAAAPEIQPGGLRAGPDRRSMYLFAIIDCLQIRQ